MYKMCVNVLVVILLCHVSTAKLHQNKDTLRLVQVIFRHGDRNPLYFYPNDPHKDDSNWTEGAGNLTLTGHQQLTRLGRHFRQVYKDYLPEEYSKDLIYVRSTYTERTQESVKALMKGLFVNTDNFTDIDICDKHADELITPFWERNCPAVKKQAEDVRASDIVVDFIKSNSDTINYIKEKAGVDDFLSPYNDITKMAFYRDVLYIENLKGFPLPEWTQPVFPGFLTDMLDLSASLYFKNEVIRRAQGGLLRTLTDNMKQTMEGTDSRVVKLFSAHDASLVMLLRSLDLPYVHLQYASYITVELHQLSSGYYVRLLLQNKTVPQSGEVFEPREVNIPGCDKMCPWNMFIDILAPYMPKDWKAECQKVKTQTSQVREHEMK